MQTQYDVRETATPDPVERLGKIISEQCCNTASPPNIRDSIMRQIHRLDRAEGEARQRKDDLMVFNDLLPLGLNDRQQGAIRRLLGSKLEV